MKKKRWLKPFRGTKIDLRKSGISKYLLVSKGARVIFKPSLVAAEGVKKVANPILVKVIKSICENQVF